MAASDIVAQIILELYFYTAAHQVHLSAVIHLIQPNYNVCLREFLRRDAETGLCV